MKARKHWNVLLGWREVSAICSLWFFAFFAWILVLSPRLVRLTNPLADSSPYAHALLFALLGFGLLPFSFAPPWLALHWYERSREKASGQQNAARRGPTE